MREHQRRAYRELRNVPRALLAWATGAGKTACALALAAHHSSKGRMPVIAAPERALLDAYVRPFSMAVDDVGTEIVRFAGAVGPKDARQLRGWLRSRRGRPTAVVCTHSMLRAAVKRGVKPVDAFLVLDEAHHTRDDGDESNVLGEVVRAFEALPILAMSASPFRADERPLMAPDVQATFVESRFGLADLLADNGLEILIRVVAGPLATAIDTLCSRKTKARIAYLPSVNTAVSKAAGGKYVVRDAVAAATARWTDEPIVDLVSDDEGRGERVAALRDAISEGKAARTCVALNLLREGWDAPETDDLVVLSAPRSLTLQTQLIGRVTRRPNASKTTASVTFCVPMGETPNADELELFLETLAGVLAIGVQLEADRRQGAGDDALPGGVPERQKRIKRALLVGARGDASEQRREWVRLSERERGELQSAFRNVVTAVDADELGINVYRAATGLLSASMVVS
ncbi:MAG: hypothetical protein JWN04_3996, partial [Myxococcaceae bacterium]|nr:hypothetical protein [Myxococcaceae bacterium]